MYTACLYCHARLGANDAIEQFPVGRRLAFDAARGRLWVVCTACARWNLTPLEERWEAIEECERQFRATRVRASTGHVGLVRLPDGLDLVRIGRPLRPEFAAWRYGRMLNRRYFRAAGWKIGGALSAGIVTGGVLAGALSVPGFMVIGGFGGPLAWWLFGTVEVERIRLADSREVRVSRRDLRDARLVPDDEAGWALMLQHDRGNLRLAGPVASGILGRLLVHVNRAGASEHVLGEALGRLEHADDAAMLLRGTARAIAHAAHARWVDETRRDWWGRTWAQEEYPGLTEVDPSLRVAMEMALHEDTERAAAEGDLAPLEAAWREAEEIAAIADGLLLPAAVTRRLETLRAEAGTRSARETR